MSITVSTCFEICQSPHNTSKSKMLFSFPKSERFKADKTAICDKFYNAPSAKSNRFASFGYGTKFDFTKNGSRSQSPAPNTYGIKTLFEEDKQKNAGHRFGEGRQETAVLGPLANVNNKNPGPGAYQSSTTLNKTAFSLRPKTAWWDPNNKVPGPGSYSTTFSLNKAGKYFCSKFRNTCTSAFSPRSSRFRISGAQIPGPGSYATDKIDSINGKQCQSRYKGSSGNTFANSSRRRCAQNQNLPGPGNYRIPSQFGHYMSKQFKEERICTQQL